MDKLTNFRSIADEAMSEIRMSEELKNKTLVQCKKKRNAMLPKVLVPAACLLLTFGYLNFSGAFTGRNNTIKDSAIKQEASELGTFVDDTKDASATISAGAQVGESSVVQGTVGLLELAGSIDEAKAAFGSSFLTPNYIPEGYKVDQIQISKDEEKQIFGVSLTYLTTGGCFVITQEKSRLSEDVSGFDQIKLKEATGYIKESESGDTPETSGTYGELHWMKDGIHYAISGSLTKEEIVKIANALRK